MVILLTGGASLRQSAGLEAAKRVRSQNIRIIAIGTSSNVTLNDLRAISSAPHRRDEDYFSTADGEGLAQRLATTVCDRPTSATAGRDGR